MTAQSLTSYQLDQLFAAPPPTSDMSDMGLGSPFLRLLSTAGRDMLSQLMSEAHYNQGEIIFKEGESGDAMYIIWAGRVAVIKGNLETPTILGYRGVGEIIGEMALLEEGQTRSASIIALEHTRVLKIRRKNFEKLLSNNPAMGLSILGTLSARLRAADDARKASSRFESQLIRQVSELQTEKQRLLELERLRQDTIDLIVHDLRHPLSSIFGAIKILEMVLPEDVMEANQQLLDIANANCDHLQLMVDSLLDVAMLESGDSQLTLSQVDLERLIDQGIDRTLLFAEMEDITVEKDFPAALPPLILDEGKIDRVIANLFNNAVKYTPTGGKITIKVTQTENQVQVSITDTGPGVAPEDYELIFDRFAQLSRNGSRGSGFGLGLAFCKLAVEAHQGRIWVEAGPNNVGSRFTFILPLTAPSSNGVS